MRWFNLYGFIFVIVMMIPNVVFALKHKEGFKNAWHNKAVEVLEQIGRIGCFAFMVVIIPKCGFAYSSNVHFALYLIIDITLLIVYCLIWLICFDSNTVFKALALSTIPACIFIFSGIITGYLPLILCSLIFVPCHIIISYKNAVSQADE